MEREGEGRGGRAQERRKGRAEEEGKGGKRRGNCSITTPPSVPQVLMFSS